MQKSPQQMDGEFSIKLIHCTGNNNPKNNCTSVSEKNLDFIFTGEKNRCISKYLP